jgi:hypothetical protein
MGGGNTSRSIFMISPAVSSTARPVMSTTGYPRLPYLGGGGDTSTAL